MLCISINGYNRACGTVTGGVSRLWVGDSEDFKFTADAADTNGDDTGYSAIAYRTGSGATGTAVLTSTAVTSVTIGAGGTNYPSGATVAFTGGGGSGATGTVTVINGVITGVTVTSGGTGYTSAPTVAFSGGASAQGGAYLYEIVSVEDNLSVDITQANTDGTSAYAYVIAARLAKLSQQMSIFNKKIDNAANCCQLLWVWQMNDGTVFVAGEKYVGTSQITKFKLKQDGSKFASGKKFTDFNGQDLSVKGDYFRLPYEFTGGISALQSFLK